MPKRSNQFQRLVYLVKKHVAGDAQVTESKMLPDLVTGKAREVDICVEQTIADHATMLSVECRDWKRKQGVGWIEEMKAKHDRLPTDLLVLASTRGFTEEATRVAESYGIQLLTLEEIDDLSIGRLFGNQQSIWAKLVSLHPNKVLIRVSSTDSPPLEAEIVQVSPENLVFRADGSRVGTARDLVNSVLGLEEIKREVQNIAAESDNTFSVELGPLSPESPLSFYLEKLDPQILRRVESIHIEGQCVIQLDEVRLERARLGTIDVVWGVGDLLGEKALVVEMEDGTGESTVKIDLNGYRLTPWQSKVQEHQIESDGDG